MDIDKIIELPARSSGLVIVDMQSEGCERHEPGVKHTTQKIRSLMTRFRKANGKIIHIQSVRSKDHPEFTVFGRPYSLLENSPGVEFVAELKPLRDETVVKKYSHDCFYQTTMEAALDRLDLRPCRDTKIGRASCRERVYVLV